MRDNNAWRKLEDGKPPSSARPRVESLPMIEDGTELVLVLYDECDREWRRRTFKNGGPVDFGTVDREMTIERGAFIWPEHDPRPLWLLDRSAKWHGCDRFPLRVYPRQTVKFVSVTLDLPFTHLPAVA